LSREPIKTIFSEWEDHCEELGRRGCISYPAEVRWDCAGAHGQPVVFILDAARGPAEMPSGELQVPKEIFKEIKAAGYAAKPLRQEECKEYWRQAKKISRYWHPEARLIEY